MIDLQSCSARDRVSLGRGPGSPHHDYARARAEFLEALEAVVADHNSGTPAAIRRECEHLLALLG